ncbi:putative galacturonosyltransferase 7 [Panicum miliaceum]|uniref:Hexosyltransferase n=1 Tax=Panicum miliaceum TaxID=4540 RepID=A0A3L6PL76_PANMI|nr:putative galacturonosyltransferase 7 [Panicum miliaceum]
MKGHQQQQHSSPLLLPPNKRRCSGLAAAVPALVVCSILLPLVFLLGLHRPGYGSEERAAVVISTKLAGVGARNKQHLENGGAMKHKLLKDVSKKKTSGSNGIPVEKSTRSKSKAKLKGTFSLVELNNDTFVSKGPHMLKRYQRKDMSGRLKDTVVNRKENHGQETVHEGNPKSCEHEYGSYCLWSTEHREVMKDAIVERLKDQLFIARAHYPSIAKIKQHERFTRELKQSIQEHERMLSDTITDADLPPVFAKKLEKMEHTIERAKSCEVGCSNVERKLRQLLDITEDEAYFHTRQSAILYHLGVQTMPKTHHCLNMRLTLEYFKSRSIRTDQLNRQKLESPAFQHYVIFSRSVLAVSTTINSTVLNCQDSGSIIFHLFTDAQNFYAMKHWFERNSYLEATVHVTNIEDHLELPKHAEMQQLLPSEEFRVTIRNYSEPSLRQMKTEYISVFGHSHFLLPDLLPSLNRVVVLDDDLIVQKDLSSLWNLNMDGKVIGAVQFCGVKLGQLRAYISEHSFNSDACVWLSGLNVIELEKWRDLRVTSLYDQSLQKLQKESLTSKRLNALPVSMLAFQDLIYPLEDSWVQSGLGHDYGISRDHIEKAATLHYNGVMKPWLDLGIHDYKSYWRKYMTTGEMFMTECNIH